MTPLLVLLAFTTQLNPQLKDTSGPLRPKTYVVTVNRGSPAGYKGYLQGITDTSLQFSKKSAPFGKGSFDQTTPFYKLDKLTVHRQGRVGRGMLFGGLGGAAFGGIVGAITYTPCPDCFFQFDQGFDIVVGAFVGFMAGLLIGTVIGNRKHRFTINRMKENFDKMRSKLLHKYGSTVNETQ